MYGENQDDEHKRLLGHRQSESTDVASSLAAVAGCGRGIHSRVFLGCSRTAIHFDVDVVDRNEIIFGLGAEADGLTSNEARRLVADVSAISDVVGLTIAEFIPRQVIRLQQVLRDFPLI